MLLNPKAVQRLKRVTESVGYWYNTYETHAQRNELARMFIEETGRLLDQQAEQTIKHSVELYCKREISYERYCELLDQVSREEEVRGAAQGGAYARNHVFDFAQRAFEREKDRMHALALAEVKKNVEVERQKADQVVKAAIHQGLAEIATTTQQYTQQHEEEEGKRVQALQDIVAQKITELSSITQTHEGHLQHLVGETKAEVDLAISTRWLEETHRREQEIYEQEVRRPAREAARTAIDRVTIQEQQRQVHRRLRNGLIGLSGLLLVPLIILFLLPSVPRWVGALLLLIVAAICFMALIWKSPHPEQTLQHNRKEVERFQTQSGEYASLAEEERCSLLVQRMI